MSHAPSSPPGARLCALSDVASDGVRGLSVGTLDVILVTDGGRHYAFENRCPHRGTTLDWTPGRLTTPDGAYLQCATHGARFERRTGRCVSGPCQGDRLRVLKLRARGSELVLDVKEGRDAP